MTISTGQTVTVEEKSSTMYQGTASTSAKAVRKGQSVLVLGTVNSTTITATQVVVGYKAPTSTETAKVVSFTEGAPTASKQVGQIPANWSAGSGTIVSGTTANKATEAASAAYPGR
jgi:cytochrome c-type biogenesis protein CcmE